MIFHVGTNDDPSNKKAKCIPESIMFLAKEVKASKLDVSISSIIPRNNNSNNKVMANSYLKDLCENNVAPFISNTIINPKKHSNSNRLHLTLGSNKPCDNVVAHLKGLTSWETAKQKWPEGWSRSEDNTCSLSRVTNTFDKEGFNYEHSSFLRKKTFKSRNHPPH